MFKWLKDLFGMSERQADKPVPFPYRGREDRPLLRPAPQRAAKFGPANPEPGEYEGHPEAVIVACFFNPQNSPYRLMAFQKWYRSIKHLNHRVIECLIGDAESQLPSSPHITQVETESLLFHKESLLNKVMAELPTQFKYVFWLDTDVLFTNRRWMVEGVQQLQTNNLIQPFEYCVHMKRNELKPSFDVEAMRRIVNDPIRKLVTARVFAERYPEMKNPEMWRSWSSNYVNDRKLSLDPNYDLHGHVGFAWGARREVVDSVQLYDRALIGGADHIIAHAGAGQVPCTCISRAFTLDLEDVKAWSDSFFDAVGGKIGYVAGDLHHIWHGEIKDREYLKRIREFQAETQFITRRDANGLWIYEGNNPYMKRYYSRREAVGGYEEGGFDGFDVGFAEDMGYALVNLIDSFGQPTYQSSPNDYIEPPTQYSEPVTLPFSSPVQSETRLYEPGSVDYTPPQSEDAGRWGNDVPETPAVVAANDDTPAVQSVTPSYEPGHWDYTPPGSDPTDAADTGNFS